MLRPIGFLTVGGAVVLAVAARTLLRGELVADVTVWCELRETSGFLVESPVLSFDFELEAQLSDSLARFIDFRTSFRDLVVGEGERTTGGAGSNKKNSTSDVVGVLHRGPALVVTQSVVCTSGEEQSDCRCVRFLARNH